MAACKISQKEAYNLAPSVFNLQLNQDTLSKSEKAELYKNINTLRNRVDAQGNNKPLIIPIDILPGSVYEGRKRTNKEHPLSPQLPKGFKIIEEVVNPGVKNAQGEFVAQPIYKIIEGTGTQLSEEQQLEYTQALKDYKEASKIPTKGEQLSEVEQEAASVKFAEIQKQYSDYVVEKISSEQVDSQLKTQRKLSPQEQIDNATLKIEQAKKDLAELQEEVEKTTQQRENAEKDSEQAKALKKAQENLTEAQTKLSNAKTDNKDTANLEAGVKNLGERVGQAKQALNDLLGRYDTQLGILAGQIQEEQDTITSNGQLITELGGTTPLSTSATNAETDNTQNQIKTELEEVENTIQDLSETFSSQVQELSELEENSKEALNLRGEIYNTITKLQAELQKSAQLQEGKVLEEKSAEELFVDPEAVTKLEELDKRKKALEEELKKSKTQKKAVKERQKLQNDIAKFNNIKGRIRDLLSERVGRRSLTQEEYAEKLKEINEQFGGEVDNFFGVEKSKISGKNKIGEGNALTKEGKPSTAATINGTINQLTAKIDKLKKEAENKPRPVSEINEELAEVNQELKELEPVREKQKQLAKQSATQEDIEGMTQILNDREVVVEASEETTNPQIMSDYETLGLGELKDNATVEQINAKFQEKVQQSLDDMVALQSLVSAYNNIMDERQVPQRDRVDGKKPATKPSKGTQLTLEFDTQEEVDKAKTRDKLNVILEEGEVGTVYELDDGTTITVKSRDEEAGTTTIYRTGVGTRVYDMESKDEDGNYSQIETEAEDIGQAREDVDSEGYTQQELFDIIEKLYNNETLSKKEQVILAKVNDSSEASVRFAKFVEAYSTVRGTEKLRQEAYSYNLGAMRAHMAIFGIDILSHAPELATKYIELSLLGRAPQSLQELMEAAGLEADVIDTYNNELSVLGSMQYWAYVTRGDVIIGGSQALALQDFVRDNGATIRNDARRLEALDFTQLSPELRRQALSTVVSNVRTYLDDQGLFIRHSENLDVMSKQGMLDLLDTLSRYANSISLTNSRAEIANNYIKLNKELREQGLDLDLSTFIALEPRVESMSIGEVLVSNDSSYLLAEFDDMLMSDFAREAVQNPQSDFIVVKNDNGHTKEVRIDEIPSSIKNSDSVKQDVAVLDGIIQQFDETAIISPDYVAAYHMVNGNATQMVARMMENKMILDPIITLSQFKNDKLVDKTKENFNKEKEEENVEEKTCK